MLPSIRQWKRWSLPSKLSFIGSLTSVIALSISMVSLVYQPISSTDIESKIKDLDNIQVALTTLNTYVGNQQNALRDISDEKSSLENERHRIQTALEIDKDKLDALLEYQLVQQRRGIWRELIISFFIGVLSSSVVTFTAIRIQNRRQRINNNVEKT